jgi:hypothetical protein
MEACNSEVDVVGELRKAALLSSCWDAGGLLSWDGERRSTSLQHDRTQWLPSERRTRGSERTDAVEQLCGRDQAEFKSNACGRWRGEGILVDPGSVFVHRKG